MILLLPLLFPLLLPVGALPPPLPHRVIMDQYNNFVMSWDPRDKDIVIQLEVATQGYVGLGFSPTGGMKGADILIGWVGADGTPHLSDRFGTGDKTPMVDPSSQDAELLFGGRNGTHTTLRFRRPWVTCDRQYDVRIGSDTMRVIWAFDEETPPSVDASPLPYHDHRGVRSLYLKEPLQELEKTSDTQHWDIRAPGVSLPHDVDTLYWCKLYKAPALRQKNHFVGYEPIITPGMENHVHHMILYECHARDTQMHLEPWVGELGAQCYDANMPVSWDACNMPLVVWAVGSKGSTMPDHVGFPLGEEHGGASYFMIEIHYNNPNFLPGLRDSSGIRLFHTPKLREFDAGVLQVGHTVEPFHIIPPGRKWLSTGHCTAQCTKLSLPDSGIKIFSGVFHSHLLGRSIGLQHIRYGRELPTLLKDDQYDFNYQQERVLPQERTVLPGDHLIISCLYDATNKRNTTYGGFKTSNEMCLAFLSYYPRQQLAECFSRPDLALVLDTLGIQNMENNNLVLNSFQMSSFDITKVNQEEEEKRLQNMKEIKQAGASYKDVDLAYYLNIMKISEPAALRGVSLYAFLNSPQTWQSEARVQTLQERVTRGQYEPYCMHLGRRMPEGMPRKDKYPPYTPYNPPVEQCTRFPPRDTASSVDNTLAGAPQRPLDEGRLQGGEEDLQGVAGGKNVKVHSSDGPNYPMDQPDAGLDEDQLQNFESSNNKLQEFRRADRPAQENSGVRGASGHCALALSVAVAWALRSLV